MGFSLISDEASIVGATSSYGTPPKKHVHIEVQGRSIDVAPWRFGWHRGVEAPGEGAAARAPAEPQACGVALPAVAGAGSHAAGDAADRRNVITLCWFRDGPARDIQTVA